jgi:glyoxylase-like metal-dependent hydrolase (beta-lactamase superfamily II)
VILQRYNYVLRYCLTLTQHEGQQMKLISINGNKFKLDGGAMFSNVPKALWQHWLKADALNRIELAARSLLLITDQHKILFEAGIGTYMSPKLKDRYGIIPDTHQLLEELSRLDIDPGEIDTIILSHLHFDHAGGIISTWGEGSEPYLIFPNATYYVSEHAWKRATNPHYRDHASFEPLITQLLGDHRQLVQLKTGAKLQFNEVEVSFLISDGHTPGMLCADLKWANQRLVFAADLIPGTHWVHLPISVAYDRYPELLVDEKEALLKSIIKDNARLFYFHDPDVAVSKVQYDKVEKRYRPYEIRPDLSIV